MLVAVVMVHLSFASADFTCARHAHHGKTSTPMTMEHHGTAARSSMSEVAASPAGSDACAIPLSADCCAAAVSCGVSFTSVRPRVASAFDRRQAVAVGNARAPRAVVASPDPPPPKA